MKGRFGKQTNKIKKKKESGLQRKLFWYGSKINLNATKIRIPTSSRSHMSRQVSVPSHKYSVSVASVTYSANFLFTTRHFFLTYLYSSIIYTYLLFVNYSFIYFLIYFFNSILWISTKRKSNCWWFRCKSE